MLSPTQLTIVQMIVHGCTDPEIAGRVGCDSAELRDELEVICKLIGAKSRTQVVVQAFRQGLVDRESNK